MPSDGPRHTPRRRAPTSRASVPRGLVAALVLLACLLGALGLGGLLRARGSQQVRGLAASASGLSLIIEPQAGTGPVLGLIAAAQGSIEMTIYELADSRVEAALESAAARGVEVHVLLGRPIGFYGRQENALALAYLRAHRVAVRYGPRRYALTHQKSIEVDGSRALIMTFNLTPRYYAADRDFAILDRRPADVAAIEDTFAYDWQDSGHSARHDGLLWSPGALPRLLTLIDRARHTLQIESEELSDPAIAQALCEAVARGVDVEATVTYQPSEAASLARLGDCGVAVRAYPQDARLYIHAKAIVADRRIVFVGSQNLSAQSLDYDRELGIVLSARPLVSTLAKTLSRDFAGADQRPFDRAATDGQRGHRRAGL